MAKMTLIIRFTMIASTIMSVAISLIISDIDMVIMAAVAITGVMAPLAVMNTLL